MSVPTQIPDSVLSWLHDSLKVNYQDVNRAYADIARTLAFQPTLTPRTDTYTSEDGRATLLVRLKGTIPVTFRGAPYRFPLSVWIPHGYPQQPPMIFVDADQTVVIRPGQHVSVEGRVYHPYLAHWQNHWNRSSILDILTILEGVFAKEPPVSARRDAAPQQRNLPIGLSHATPALAGPRASPLPPVPPPKFPGQPAGGLAKSAADESVGPPRPPKVDRMNFPLESRPQPPLPSSAGPNNLASRASIPYSQPMPSHTRSVYPPAVPSRQSWQISAGGPPTGDASHGSALGIQPVLAQRPATEIAFTAPKRFTEDNIPGEIQAVHDLMSSPLDTSARFAVSDSAALAAPPIPRNPEKETVISAVSRSLRAVLTNALAQNQTALPALEAQQAALHAAMRNMQSEKFRLEELNETLMKNQQILRSSIIDAEEAVEKVRQRDSPNVDDVLVAPTTVGEQLYKLVADARSIDDAMFTLTKALDKGRVGSEVFIKQTRSLAREQFLHKALTKKIARGMGLVVPATM